MVSKAKSIKGSVASIDYIQSDKSLGDALELDRNGLIGKDGKEIMEEMRMVQKSNIRCQKSCISMVISPSSEKEFSVEELREIGREHLKGLGLDKNQYLMTVHNSTGKPHIHIIANRIDNQGKAVKDNFISLKSQDISERIAKEKGLMTAKDWKKANEMTLKPVKEEIKTAHIFAKNNSQNYEEYKNFMQLKGVKVHDSINKNGQLQGFKLEHKQSGMTFKASEISKDVGAKDLIQKGIKMPMLSSPLQQIATKVVQQVVRQVSKGMGFGY